MAARQEPATPSTEGYLSRDRSRYRSGDVFRVHTAVGIQDAPRAGIIPAAARKPPGDCNCHDAARYRPPADAAAAALGVPDRVLDSEPSTRTAAKPALIASQRFGLVPLVNLLNAGPAAAARFPRLRNTRCDSDVLYHSRSGPKVPDQRQPRPPR